MSQKLRGFVGQSMSGERKALTPVVYSYRRGAWTFTAPRPGQYQFAAWGGGGGGNTGILFGGSGALVSGVRALARGQTVAMAVGVGGTENADGSATTVTFPDGSVMTAGGGISGATTGAGGVASSTSNLDILTNGGAAASGGIAPAFGTFAATTAGTANESADRASGGTTTTATTRAGHGEVIIYQIRMRP